jgi:hypothetical protein
MSDQQQGTDVTVVSKFDLEHTYEFVNHGEPWKRPDSDEVIETGKPFRARAAELDFIEAEGERFEHVRTLPYPPTDLARAPKRVSGMQRRDPAQQPRQTRKAEGKKSRTQVST